MADIFVITRQHSCARFVDLDTSTKEKVLEKYRDYNTDGFDWWDCVYWDFEERMKAHGVTVDLKKTFFRLSYSQGDYASFAAQVTDLDAFLKELGGFDKKAIRLIKYAFNEGYLQAICTGSSGRSGYQHTSLSWTNPHDDFCGYFTERVPERGQIDAWAFAQKTLEDFEQACTEFFEDEAHSLYKALEREYEYLTSEDALADSFEANGCLFEINTGRLFYMSEIASAS